MPFPNQNARQFNRQNVEALEANQHGCYGLFRQGRWIYVGKGDIRQRLLDHLNGDNACITQANPTSWVDVVTADADAQEKALTVELRPSCNRQIG